MNLSQSLGKLNHHAYALVGDESVRLTLVSFLEGEHGIATRGNPDFFARKYEVLTIDDARALKEAHATRPFSGGNNMDDKNDKNEAGGVIESSSRKFFVLEIDSITHEAQNALLKMFEEPNDYAYFFLIIPSEELLLPTLRSRLFLMRGEMGKGGSTKDDKNIVDFLLNTRAERIAFVDKLAADISDEKKPKSAALDFCAGLSRHLRADGIEKNAVALAVIAQTESYLRDRAPSVKQLLEHVALCC